MKEMTQANATAQTALGWRNGLTPDADTRPVFPHLLSYAHYVVTGISRSRTATRHPHITRSGVTRSGILHRGTRNRGAERGDWPSGGGGRPGGARARS